MKRVAAEAQVSAKEPRNREVQVHEVSKQTDAIRQHHPLSSAAAAQEQAGHPEGDHLEIQQPHPSKFSVPQDGAQWEDLVVEHPVESCRPGVEDSVEVLSGPNQVVDPVAVPVCRDLMLKSGTFSKKGPGLRKTVRAVSSSCW